MNYEEPNDLIDINGDRWEYRGAKPAQDLNHLDIGLRVCNPDSPVWETSVLESFTVDAFCVLIVGRRISDNRVMKHTLSWNELTHLWEKVPEPVLTKEFRFSDIHGNVIIQGEFEEESLRPLYENTNAITVESRAVGEWKKYNFD